MQSDPSKMASSSSVVATSSTSVSAFAKLSKDEKALIAEFLGDRFEAVVIHPFAAGLLPLHCYELESFSTEECCPCCWRKWDFWEVDPARKQFYFRFTGLFVCILFRKIMSILYFSKEPIQWRLVQ